MTFNHILVLAIVQGITEFLPISSSGHLVVSSQVLGWPDQGLLIDIALHVGTLFAVMLYYWRDLWQMVAGLFRLITGRGGPGARLVLQVVIATIPIVLAGYFGKALIETHFRSVEVIAWATVGFGILLWISDKLGMTFRRIEHVGYGNALFIGLMQVLALIPGTSRAGICMTACRFLGMERAEAARLSMLLAIPAIAGAGAYSGMELYETGNLALTETAITAAGLSFVAALISIALLMQWLKRASFTPFVVYRLLLGAGLLYWVYG